MRGEMHACRHCRVTPAAKKRRLEGLAPRRWHPTAAMAHASDALMARIYDLTSSLPASDDAAKDKALRASLMASAAHIATEKSYKSPHAGVDVRFANTNQAQHCWARLNEYQGCLRATGGDKERCELFNGMYESMCPSSWVREGAARARMRAARGGAGRGGAARRGA